jgi:hypothetical protein
MVAASAVRRRADFMGAACHYRAGSVRSFAAIVSADSSPLGRTIAKLMAA